MRQSFVVANEDADAPTISGGGVSKRLFERRSARSNEDKVGAERQ